MLSEYAKVSPFNANVTMIIFEVESLFYSEVKNFWKKIWNFKIPLWIYNFITVNQQHLRN